MVAVRKAQGGRTEFLGCGADALRWTHPTYPKELTTMYQESLATTDGSSGSNAVRVLLVDDNWTFLGSAEHFLSAEPDVQVVGCASSGREALDQVPLLKPDIVLMDVAMPHMNGLTAGRLLKAMSCGPRLVLLSLNDHPTYRAEARAIGADGFLNKSEFGSHLLPMIRQMFNRA